MGRWRALESQRKGESGVYKMIRYTCYSRGDMLIVAWLALKSMLDIVTIIYLVFRFGKE